MCIFLKGFNSKIQGELLRSMDLLSIHAFSDEDGGVDLENFGWGNQKKVLKNLSFSHQHHPPTIVKHKHTSIHV